MRGWLNKYVKGSGDLPLADSLRRKFIPIVGEKTVEEIKTAIQGKQLAILSDETTDKGGNCVFHILFSTLEASGEQHVFLAASVVLDAANGVNCARAVIDTINKYGVDYDNCIAFVTDSAKYMTSCYQTLQGMLGDQLLHTQCWAHKVNLVGQIWQQNLEELNNLVAKVKSAFLNTRKRKYQYSNYLRRKHGPNSEKIKLFPMPVQTRWNTWFKAVIYINEYIEDIIGFLEEISEEQNAGIKYLKHIAEDELLLLHIQASFVSENCEQFIKLIELLEGSKYPTAHVLYTKLSDVSSSLNLLSGGLFSTSLELKLNKLNALKKAAAVEKLKNTARLSYTKLQNLMANDPSKAALQSCDNLFNPRNISRQNINPRTISTFLTKLSRGESEEIDTFLKGYSVLQQIVKDEMKKPEVKHVDICQLLLSIKSEFPAFVNFALKAVWLLTSNVDAERSFSRYSIVVTDRRRRLKPENAEILTMVAFD